MVSKVNPDCPWLVFLALFKQKHTLILWNLGFSSSITTANFSVEAAVNIGQVKLVKIKIKTLSNIEQLYSCHHNLLLITNHYWKVTIQRQFMKEFYLISGSHKSENWEKNIQPYYDVGEL